MYSLRPEKHVAGVVHCQFYKKALVVSKQSQTSPSTPSSSSVVARASPGAGSAAKLRDLQPTRKCSASVAMYLQRSCRRQVLTPPPPRRQVLTPPPPRSHPAAITCGRRWNFNHDPVEQELPLIVLELPRVLLVLLRVHLELPPVRHRDPPTGIVGAGLHDPVDRSSRASSVVSRESSSSSHASPWCSFSACVPAGGASPCCCILFLLCFSPATGGANPCCCCSSSRVDATAPLPVLLLLIRAVLLLLLLTPAVTAAAGAICTLKKVLHQSTATYS